MKGELKMAREKLMGRIFVSLFIIALLGLTVVSGITIASNGSDDSTNAAKRPILTAARQIFNDSKEFKQKRQEITAAIKEKQLEMEKKKLEITTAIAQRHLEMEQKRKELNQSMEQRKHEWEQKRLELANRLKEKKLERNQTKERNIAERDQKKEELKQKLDIRKEEKKQARGNELDARYSHLVCKINLGVAQAENLADYVSADTLTEQNDQIISDLEILNGYVESGNVSAFNNFEKTTLRTDVKDLQDLIKGLTHDIKALNLSDEEKKSIRDSWKESVSAYAQCNSESKKDVVSARSNFIDEQISEWNDAIEAAKLEGIDTSDLEEIVADAQELSKILDEAANATTDDLMKAKIDEVRNLHLHLWARFNIAKVDAYLSEVETQANEAGKQDKVAEIRELLSEASAIAQPGKVYADGEFQATWQKIKSASDKLRELVKSLKA
jgi:hypothetical protein